MVKIRSVRDCTEFQVFVLIHLYGRQIKGMPGATQLLTIQEVPNVTPDKLLPDNEDEMRKQLDSLVENKLLVDEYSNGIYKLGLNGEIFAIKYLGSLPEDKDVIKKTPGESELKKFFIELFDEIKKKSKEEIAKAILSATIKYGSPTAMVYLVEMAHHIGLHP
jgi:hypothetical protein